MTLEVILIKFKRELKILLLNTEKLKEEKKQLLSMQKVFKRNMIQLMRNTNQLMKTI